MKANPNTVLLRLSPELGERLARAADSRGVTRQAIITGVLDATLPPASTGRTLKAWRQLTFPGFPADDRQAAASDRAQR